MRQEALDNEQPITRLAGVLTVLAALLAVCAAVAAAPSAGAQEGGRVESFVPQSDGATVQMLSEATVTGDAIQLKHIARWAQSDRAALDNLADVTIAHLPEGKAFATIEMDDVQDILRDAGINLAMVSFVGANTCTVSRADVQFNEGEAMRQWVQARDGDAPAVKINDVPAANPEIKSQAQPERAASAAPASQPANGTEDGTFRSLRELLAADVADRLGMPADALVIRFQGDAEQYLRLVEPLFHFTIEPIRRGLGDVSWSVVIVGGKGRQRATISATARAWQQQVVASRPLAARQVIQQGDVVERRVLVNHLPDEPLATMSAIVGNQAGRDIPEGMILISRMIEPVPLVRVGQLVSITVEAGQIQLRTVAEARETGVFGQTIRVRKPNTNSDFQVVITGPQSAKVVGSSG